jgi:putative molybdopterin biosynthesis protein
MDREAEGEVRLYTLTEIQRRLSIGRTKSYELVTKGELPAIRVGRSLRVRAQDLERFVQNNRY